MRLTTKGRFAVTAMLDLALHAADGPVTLSGISERQKISLSYLEQLFGKLRRRAIVESVRGPGGGYNLARNAADVSVADIILAVEDQLDSTACGGRRNCMGDKRCMTHELWESLNETVYEHLSSVKLSHLVANQTTHPVNVVKAKQPVAKAQAPELSGAARTASRIS